MPHDRKPGPRRKKLVISFDDKTRSEYLTGFQKRKNQRRAKAQNDIAKKLKQKVRDERNKQRKATREKADEILANVYGVDQLIKDTDDAVSQTATEKVEFENHEVFVNTDLNFGDSGFLVDNNVQQENEEEPEDQNEEAEEATSQKRSKRGREENNKLGKWKKKKSRKV